MRFADRHVNGEDVRRSWFQRAGYGDVVDVRDDILDRWGEDAAALFDLNLAADPVMQAVHLDTNRRDYATTVAHLHVPAALYLDYLERAIRLLGNQATEAAFDAGIDQFNPYEEAAYHLNELFARRGIVYRFTADGQAEWHGDEGAYVQTVQPALAALGDERLATAGREFRDALDALRRGDRVGVKNAIRDASNAVETTMKALLDAHEQGRPETETADRLWDELRRHEIVAERTKEEVCGPSHLRNRYGGHGPDPARDEPVPDGVAELAVMTAAAAIVYLARLMPWS